MRGSIRRAAVDGQWYPGSAAALAEEVDRHVAAANLDPGALLARVTALVAPHAGLTYSGGVAGHAYRLLRDHPVEIVVLVGPSHFVSFEGVAIHARGGFDTPLGVAEIDEGCASALMAATPVVHEYPVAHAREHSLEMQLPFLRRLLPRARIVPLLMGRQTADTVRALGDALSAVLPAQNAVLVASTDLSHYHDAAAAARLDAVVIDYVSRFEADGLERALNECPEHVCGGGPTVAVMRAAKQLGAREAVILKYADSGDVSGDKAAVVGYLAAALGRRD